VTAQVGAAWAEAFTDLEVHHGLDINNSNHIWLLHLLFLAAINVQLAFFAESWNKHKMQIRSGPNRSPEDMFGFDMLVHGVRGNTLFNDDSMAEEELEVFGIDWAAYRDERVLQSVREHSTNEPASSWIGRIGPPPHLNEVPLHAPAGPEESQMMLFEDGLVAVIQASGQGNSIPEVWSRSLAFAHHFFGDLF